MTFFSEILRILWDYICNAQVCSSKDMSDLKLLKNVISCKISIQIVFSAQIRKCGIIFTFIDWNYFHEVYDHISVSDK